MKRSHKAAAGIVAGLSLALASAAFAHPEGMQQGMQHGMTGGMNHAGMGHAGMGKAAEGMSGGPSLMAPDERSAFQEKMRDAKTPEERRKLAEAMRAEAQKRGQEHAH